MIASDGPGLTFFEDEYDPSTPVSIVCGNSVYIEVTLVDDCAEQLEFLVEEEKEEFLSRILLEKLKNFQFMEFEKLLLRATTRYYHLDNLQTTFSQIKLKPILFALEADLNTIHLHQLKLFGPQICLTHKMGLLTKQCTGYWISYLNKDNTKNLQTLIPDLPSDYDSEFFSNLGKYAPENLFYSVSVSIEESSRSNFFPVCSGIRNLQDDGSVLFSSVPLNPSSEAVGPVQLTFVLWLSPPVPITIASKHKIFTFQNSPPGW
eukprot:TRINITY_DN5194_c0_g3_i15.p1 TRINITY_DN5194_c0_g3~~TRINITY_DN5194_c0_g3_i15.p1  ORF type:complete len:262 (+),score=63.35 TRINITY_DN5194_c0_g3_i15:840-1625(+)